MRIFDPGDTILLHEQVSEYASLLSELVKSSKPIGTENSEVYEALFSMLGETLCTRDELDHYLAAKNCDDTRSILNCDSLDNYQELFDYLSVKNHLSDIPLAIADVLDESVEIQTASVSSCVGLISFALRTFGVGENSWARLRDAYFPYMDAVYLRRTYYKGIANCETVSAVIPRPWTLDEDYIVTTESERFGLNIHSLHAIFVSLGEGRTFDEITGRASLFFYRPKPKRKNKCRILAQVDSDWSVDDTLLRE